MNDQNREALDAYYKEAATWNRDRLEALNRSRRTAWWVAGSAAAVAVLLALALMLLMPLKTVVPYTLMVDKTTGYVQALKPLNPDKVSPDSALTQSFLVQYVIGRESYDVDTVRTNYNKVALWSAETARADYLSLMQVSNPASPLNAYGRNTVIETDVKSVSPVSANAALVRFDTIRRDANGVPQPPRSWVALVRYHYSGEPMKLEDRFINPLGFQVLRYRKDPETAPPLQTTPVPVAVPGITPVVAVPSTTNVTVVTPGAAPAGVQGGTGAFAPPTSSASPLAPAARAAAQRAQQRRAVEPPL
ncbi:MAG TPA: VirB8/TrbF family protein [Allosphingosinicella sp.]|jgi:type IV secretion system protein VirB8|nr:VirB8/TrbF family protein [Allosphingosinicella sp.]